jgi:LmbE family N-acetylglucosaminyl deacetylase
MVNIKYKAPFVDRQKLFANKKCMFFVPHQDDEFNIGLSVIEQYADYRSEVFIVFITNGDRYGQSEGIARLKEAISALNMLGVKEENIIFLGYGNEWQGIHIYNTKDDEAIHSFIGKTETYALSSHPSLHSKKYTKKNIKNDIIYCLEHYKPDIVFGIDYDNHPDHRAGSLFLEEALHEIFVSREGYYRPIVLKGFAYNTAYYGKKDYYGLNIKSTVQCLCHNYKWEERIRFPVYQMDLTRTKWHSNAYHALRNYTSHGAAYHFENIFSGDKIFFRRMTNNLLFLADISVSSGNAGPLNDFKLGDSSSVDRLIDYDTGAWVPDRNDELKEINIIFREKQKVSRIVIYGNNDTQDNAVSFEVYFENYFCGNIEQITLSGTTFNVSLSTPIKNITLKMKTLLGSCAGLTEIEVFGEIKNSLDFIKLLDRDENFLYDYTPPVHGSVELKLYSSITKVDFSGCEIVILCNNRNVPYKINNGILSFVISYNKNCIVKVMSKENPLVYDVIAVHNRSITERFMILLLQHIEKFTITNEYIIVMMRRFIGFNNRVKNKIKRELKTFCHGK